MDCGWVVGYGIGDWWWVVGGGWKSRSVGCGVEEVEWDGVAWGELRWAVLGWNRWWWCTKVSGL